MATTTPPPALDPTQAVLGINNGPGLYICDASLGATIPGIGTAWASPWEPLGYVSEDGVTVSPDVSSDTITPWQSTSPIRTVITGKAISMQFILWQTNPQNLGVYFDMDTAAASSATSYAFDIRSDEGGYIYSVGLDILDGENALQIMFPRAQLSGNGDVTFSRGAVIGWDVTLSALDDAGVLAHIAGGVSAPSGAAASTGTTLGAN